MLASRTWATALALTLLLLGSFAFSAPAFADHRFGPVVRRPVTGTPRMVRDSTTEQIRARHARGVERRRARTISQTRSIDLRNANARPRNARAAAESPTYFREIAAQQALPIDLVRGATRVAELVGTRGNANLPENTPPAERFEALLRLGVALRFGEQRYFPGLTEADAHRIARARFGLDTRRLGRELQRIGTRAFGHPMRVTMFEVDMGRGTPNETPHADGANTRDATLVIPLGPTATSTRYVIDPANPTQPANATVHGSTVLHSHGAGPRIRAWLRFAAPSDPDWNSLRRPLRR